MSRDEAVGLRDALRDPDRVIAAREGFAEFSDFGKATAEAMEGIYGGQTGQAETFASEITLERHDVLASMLYRSAIVAERLPAQRQNKIRQNPKTEVVQLLGDVQRTLARGHAAVGLAHPEVVLAQVGGDPREPPLVTESLSQAL